MSVMSMPPFMTMRVLQNASVIMDILEMDIPVLGVLSSINLEKKKLKTLF